MVEGEPLLDELVAEPIVRMMMPSDGVDIATFKRLLEDVRQMLESRRRALLDPLDGGTLLASTPTTAYSSR